ncbi:5-histidylcysteine sulfoxide synthase [Plakobranchus ocellatus]|uniref:5-histidylcysteine sulfoxide synthase n=1 Tax=Plakobranchus ocellatus TaxID=259542 RepID=A0AAV4AVG6_9GAST|nr:5-histidylcysteine sulfoxide synthase [Plakobranchus ocellatus]
MVLFYSEISLSLVSGKTGRCNYTKQADIINYFVNSYDLYESLFLGLKDESVFYKSPDRLRLPLVFYFGHTAAVFANKLVLAGLIKERVNLEFETMFETGVDEMSWDDTENYRMGGSYKWPSIKEVVEYRRKMRELILQVMTDMPLVLPITMESPWWAVMMGIEHERVHLETSSVLIRQLPISLVSFPAGWKYGPLQADHPVKVNKMVTVPETDVTVGKPEDFPSYGWDNEYGQATYTLPSFEASQYLVTNREFLEFVNCCGYQSRDLWSSEGWEWVQYRQARHPTFWICDQGCKSGCGADLAKETHCPPRPALVNGSTNGDSPDCKRAKTGEYKYVEVVELDPVGINYAPQLTKHFKLRKGKHNHVLTVSTQQSKTRGGCIFRLLFDVVDLPLDWPVEVNYHEAKAFCAWKGQGYRLPTEAEHNAIRENQLPPSKGVVCDVIFHKDMQANLNLQFGSSTPVNMFAASATGHYDTMGNVSEWVEDQYNGLPGFNTHYLYDDFSSPCFDGKHNVIMGGSWISTGDYGSRFARIAFRRHFFQHCGFRLAKSTEPESKIPARTVATEVFVLGAGVETPSDTSDISKHVMIKEPSTNTAYICDTLDTLKGILELEFGFRDSFAAAVAQLCCNYCQSQGVSTQSAVHIGAGTGRAAFELSKTFSEVLGLEPFARLIDTAIGLQNGRSVALKDGSPVTLASDYNLDRITFKQFTWIANEVESHDLVLLTNLDRVANAKAWLIRLWEITNPEGLVVIASKDKAWGKEALEGFLDNRLKCVGENQMSFENPSGQEYATVTFWKHNE